MHDSLLDLKTDEVQEVVKTYGRECQLMVGLRHPNIAQFLGLCFREESELPLLVMERLEMNVNDLIDYALNIPFPLKISILNDTCNGLVYLHTMKTPIIHGDLTAKNVLLTSSLTAKITDLSNSRILNLRPGQFAQHLTKTPETTVYMPPEAINEDYRYGPSLDVFSLGHLILYVLLQV